MASLNTQALEARGLELRSCLCHCAAVTVGGLHNLLGHQFAHLYEGCNCHLSELL